ncbi:MAG TPA: hypothetical protein VMU30_12880 [Bacteroidota bacterium]|nr:hypothetical protein [Bacteroidota bacterium]
MKKFALLGIIIFVFTNGGSGQSIYYDVFSLRKYINADGELKPMDDMYKVLACYSQNTTPTNSTLDVEFDGGAGKNPFIIISSSTHAMVSYVNQPISFSPLSNLNVTALADGMAKFLVTRAKEELTISFFDNFRSVINDSRFKDLQTLFPATYKTLNAIGDQIYYYDAYLQTLRDSFKKDLHELPQRLPTIIDNHPDYFLQHPGMEAIFRSGLYLYDSLSMNKTFGPVLRNYPVAYLGKLNPNIKASVQTVQLISESLRDTAWFSRPNAYWVSKQQIEKLLEDTVAFKIYLGLLYQKAKIENITFDHHVTLTSVLDTVAAKYDRYADAYRTYFWEIGNKTDELTSFINKYQDTTIKLNDTAKLEFYAQYVSTGIDLLETATDVSSLGLTDSSIMKVNNFFLHAQDSLSAYITTMRSAANLVFDIKQRDYTSSIVNVFQIYSATLGNSSSESNRKIMKYGTFMASIVQAKTSDEVEQAIEATALPVGSSRLKKESCVDISLNAFVGFYGGYERIKGLDGPLFENGNFNSFGLTAPIGVCISTGTCIGSFSLFVSFVDIGSVASFRFSNDSTKQVPSITLQDIISPGAMISYGIPGVPLSLNFGAQIGPNLRAVTATANDYSNAMYYRYSISLCVDIPLFDFYNKPK